MPPAVVVGALRVASFFMPEASLGATPVDVIASGGVGSMEDLASLDAVEVDGRRLSGVITGKAIYEGHVDVAGAVRLLGGTP